jgi:hypothetical protein
MSFFVNAHKSSSEASTPTSRGDALGTKLAKNHRFGSPGLNLAFEGLLLGANLWLYVKGTGSIPR